MIDLNNVQFGYSSGEFLLVIPELHIAKGETVAIVGPTGCGKTTLLWLIAGILTPVAGSVCVNEHVLSSIGDKERRRFRISRVGIVFQDLELVEYLTVQDNILLPFRINRAQRLSTHAIQETERLVLETGLQGKCGRYPVELSQGERQRVALCRALVTSPELMLCDEPTSALDSATSKRILDLLFNVAQSRGNTLVMSTHNREILKRFDRVIDVASLQTGA